MKVTVHWPSPFQIDRIPSDSSVCVNVQIMEHWISTESIFHFLQIVLFHFALTPILSLSLASECVYVVHWMWGIYLQLSHFNLVIKNDAISLIALNSDAKTQQFRFYRPTTTSLLFLNQ